MPIQHAKSPCCREKIYYYGSRRRQCVLCRRTWRVRQRKRGRKSIRISSTLAQRYLSCALPSLPNLARQYGIPVARIRYRMRRSLKKLLASPLWSAPPDQIPLIAIADAIWQWIGKKRYTLHIILLKPLGSAEAIICPPLLREGDETLGWPVAFSQIPPEWKSRIIALVCDGNSGLVAFARHNNWLLQRCHAHLRRFLNNYLRTGPRGTQRELAKEVHNLVTIILTCRDRLTVARSALRLREIYHIAKSRGIRKVISGFIKHIPEYRTYLEYPDINLPTTTNAVESLNNLVRGLQRAARGFCSPQSFLNWVSAVLMTKNTMVCNGKFQPKK